MELAHDRGRRRGVLEDPAQERRVERTVLERQPLGGRVDQRPPRRVRRAAEDLLGGGDLIGGVIDAGDMEPGEGISNPSTWDSCEKEFSRWKSRLNGKCTVRPNGCSSNRKYSGGSACCRAYVQPVGRP
jgi:hypothetical protein